MTYTSETTKISVPDYRNSKAKRELSLSIAHMTPAEYKSRGKNMLIDYAWHKTVLGDALFLVSDGYLCGLVFIGDDGNRDERLTHARANWELSEIRENPSATEQAYQAIFGDGKQLSLLLKGTDFQQQVWHALLQIPLGQTKSYADIASDIGKDEKTSRAVGGANGSNPVSLIVPCHRVIAHDGTLGGYAWGLEFKANLLKAEGVTL